MGYIDLSKMKQEYVGDEDILLELISILLTTYKEKMSTLEEGIKSRNLNDIEMFSHNLKGTFSNFHAEAVSNGFKEIEFMVKDNNVEGLDDKFKALEAVIEDVVVELNNIKSDLEQKKD
ncbi:MAG: Hpt domain-containing protein [Bacteriovoracaceae bacterium]